MRLIRYHQGALEQVIDTDIPTNNFLLEAGQEYFLNNGVVFLAGISDRIDICTDKQGVYVAVFTKDPADKNRVKFLDPARRLECRGAVFLRDRERNEFSPNMQLSCSNINAVDGLRVLHKINKPNRVFFKQNGKSTLYSVLA